MNTVRQLPLRIPIAEYDALKAYAHFTETSMNDVVVRAVREFVLIHGRDEQFEAMLTKAQTRYKTVLDKLAEL